MALGDGFYFTDSYDDAFKYANGRFSKGQDRGGIIMPVYLRMERPFIITEENRQGWKNIYQRGEHDGIIDTRNGTYFMEDGRQVKSATENIGTFDGEDIGLSERKIVLTSLHCSDIIHYVVRRVSRRPIILL